MSSWEHFGEIANVAQLTGVDAVRLIGMIVQAANTARMHKKNCRQFAMHLKLIGNLLEQLKISELKKYPETREPLEQLEDALRRSYILVNSCQDRSYLYLLAMGWNIVYQFRKAQTEIDRYLKIIPLITLVDNARVRERLEIIDRDQREYTLDDEDRKVQDVIMNRDPSVKDTVVLKKTLSCSYPNLPFTEAIKKENEKLQLELQRSQAHYDVNQCEMIQHLLEVTEAVAATSVPEKVSPKKTSKEMDHSFSDLNNDNEHYGERYTKSVDKHPPSRNTSSVSSKHDLLDSQGSHEHEEWHSDLLGCCSEPLLYTLKAILTRTARLIMATNFMVLKRIFELGSFNCTLSEHVMHCQKCLSTFTLRAGIKTFFFPCWTFSRVATVATSRHVSSSEACNEMMAYSLILSCCCYTCCIRQKLRKQLNIAGGLCDDFLSHLMCCCCALVQEYREVKIRGIHGFEKTKTSPPASQYMES